VQPLNRWMGMPVTPIVTGMLLTLTLLGWRVSPAQAGLMRVATGPLGAGVTVRQEVKSVQELGREDVVGQQLDYSCGSASLSTILTYYLSDPISEREIIDSILARGDFKSIISRRGFSLYDLKRFAEDRGASAEGYTMDFEALSALEGPIIIPLKLTDRLHFVVYRGVRAGRVFLADPALGKRTLSAEKFQQQWDPPVGLLIKRPEAELPPGPLSPENGKDPYLWEQGMRTVLFRSWFSIIRISGEL